MGVDKSNINWLSSFNPPLWGEKKKPKYLFFFFITSNHCKVHLQIPGINRCQRRGFWSYTLVHVNREHGLALTLIELAEKLNSKPQRISLLNLNHNSNKVGLPSYHFFIYYGRKIGYSKINCTPPCKVIFIC